MSRTFGQDFQGPCRLFIQMSGAPGSGKSTMARLLRQSIGGLVIDHDIFRSALLEDNDVSFDQAAKRAYRLQWTFAQDVLKQGLNVIIDSTATSKRFLTRAPLSLNNTALPTGTSSARSRTWTSLMKGCVRETP